jgi:sortase A
MRRLDRSFAMVGRGGSVGPDQSADRNWMHAAAPGIAFRSPRVESSPADRGARTGAAARRSPDPAPGRVRRNALRATAATLAVAGALALGQGAWLWAKAEAGQWLLERAWQRTQLGDANVAPWPWADTRPIARLVAPAQGVDLIVLAGASASTLAWGPGHLAGSARPGEPGHVILTAHRDTHFRFLRTLAVGDPLVLEVPGGARRHYRVRSLATRHVAELALPRDTARPTVTLVTCWPFDALVPGGPWRRVVTAEADAST